MELPAISRSSNACHGLPRCYGQGISRQVCWQARQAAFLSGKFRAFPRLSACASTPQQEGQEQRPTLGPRMPAEPEPRPKPTTAVEVVEKYLDNLWRDFFTHAYRWMDNRLKRRAPKYADFKNKLTKEGLWITAKYNPPWVRTELSLMTNFKPVPYDDPVWNEKNGNPVDNWQDSGRGASLESSSSRSMECTRESVSSSRPSFATTKSTSSNVWGRNGSVSGSTM